MATGQFKFEDIVLLSDIGIQKFLRDADSQDIVNALKGASPEVQDRIFRNLSTFAVKALKGDMERMGPVMLKDIDEAQQKLVSIICRLEDSGEVTVASSGEKV